MSTDDTRHRTVAIAVNDLVIFPTLDIESTPGRNARRPLEKGRQAPEQGLSRRARLVLFAAMAELEAAGRRYVVIAEAPVKTAQVLAAAGRGHGRNASTDRRKRHRAY